MKRTELEKIYAISKQKILKFIKSMAEVPTSAIIAERFNIPRFRVLKIIQQLKKEGLI